MPMMTAEDAVYIVRRRPQDAAERSVVARALRVLAESGATLYEVEVDAMRRIDADEIAILASARESGRMTDESQAFRVLRTPDLVGTAEALEACRYLGDQDGRDLMSMPGGAVPKAGVDGAQAWGLERLRRQSGRMATDAERAAYSDAMTLAMLDVACG